MSRNRKNKPILNFIWMCNATNLKCKAGLIPEELYPSELQAREKMAEIKKRLENEEQVISSELPPNPCALRDYLLANKARLYGDNVLRKIYSSLACSDPDIVWLSFVKEATLILTSIDPQPIHFYSARKVLKEKYEIEDSRAVDILSREILEHCKNISNFKSFNHKVFSKNPIEIEDLHDHLKHEKHDMLHGAKVYLPYINLTFIIYYDSRIKPFGTTLFSIFIKH